MHGKECVSLVSNATLNGWWAKDECLLKGVSAAKLCTSCLQGNARMYHRRRRWSQSLYPETQRETETKVKVCVSQEHCDL